MIPWTYLLVSWPKVMTPATATVKHPGRMKAVTKIGCRRLPQKQKRQRRKHDNQRRNQNQVLKFTKVWPKRVCDKKVNVKKQQKWKKKGGKKGRIMRATIPLQAKCGVSITVSSRNSLRPLFVDAKKNAWKNWTKWRNMARQIVSTNFASKDSRVSVAVAINCEPHPGLLARHPGGENLSSSAPAKKKISGLGLYGGCEIFVKNDFAFWQSFGCLQVEMLLEKKNGCDINFSHLLFKNLVQRSQNSITDYR